MVFPAPAAVDAPPVPPHRGRHQRRRIAEGRQGHTFQGHDDQGEGTATDKITAAVSQDSCSSSCHLYHRLITYPLEEIRLPATQVGGAADRVVEFCQYICIDQRGTWVVYVFHVCYICTYRRFIPGERTNEPATWFAAYSHRMTQVALLCGIVEHRDCWGANKPSCVHLRGMF